jgi:predicted nucleotidyltransferase
MEIRSSKELWTLEGAVPILRRIAAIAEEHGFTVALYGSVLMKGESESDLDLYFIAAEEKTSAVHAQSYVDAIEKTLGEAKCVQLTPNCTRIQLKWKAH